MCCSGMAFEFRDVTLMEKKAAGRDSLAGHYKQVRGIPWIKAVRGLSLSPVVTLH